MLCSWLPLTGRIATYSWIHGTSIRPRQPSERNAATITAMHVFCVACFPVATYVAQWARWAAVALVVAGFITILFGITLRRYVFIFWLIFFAVLSLAVYLLPHVFDGWQH